jgi:hypothetical protein
MIASDPIRDFALEVAERGDDTLSRMHRFAHVLAMANPSGVVPEGDIAYRVQFDPDSPRDKELGWRLVDACRDAEDRLLYAADLFYFMEWLDLFAGRRWPEPCILPLATRLVIPQRRVRKRS